MLYSCTGCANVLLRLLKQNLLMDAVCTFVSKDGLKCTNTATRILQHPFTKLHYRRCVSHNFLRTTFPCSFEDCPRQTNNEFCSKHDPAKKRKKVQDVFNRRHPCLRDVEKLEKMMMKEFKDD